MRHCLQCTEPLVDESGNPRYDITLCGKVCTKKDRREKVAAKRARLRGEIMRRVENEIKRLFKKGPSKEAGA